MKHIDLRSDTVTWPPQEMKKAMIEAELGDDVFGDDPTVKELEALAAHMLGKEAAVFVPTGHMGNQLAVYTHCRPGQEVILPDDSHPVTDEAGACAIISKVQLRTLETEKGAMNLKQVNAKIRRDKDDAHFPSTGLILVQNPSGAATVLNLDYMKQLKEIADKEKVPVHMDGARIFNAAAYLKVEAKEIAQYADTVMFCLSKGLCCPIGSMLVGSKDFIERARKNRKMLGGGMRQVGMLAAAGIWALKNMVPRIGEDLLMAQLLAKELGTMKDKIHVNNEKPEINMVFFKILDKKANNDDIMNFMLERGIKVESPPIDWNGNWRFVTHFYITEKDIKTVIESLQQYFESINK